MQVELWAISNYDDKCKMFLLELIWIRSKNKKQLQPGLFKIITNHSIIFLPWFWLLDTCKCIQFDNNWRKWAFTKTLFSYKRKTHIIEPLIKKGEELLKNLAPTQIVNNISKKGLLGGPKKPLDLFFNHTQQHKRQINTTQQKSLEPSTNFLATVFIVPRNTWKSKNTGRRGEGRRSSEVFLFSWVLANVIEE